MNRLDWKRNSWHRKQLCSSTPKSFPSRSVSFIAFPLKTDLTNIGLTPISLSLSSRIMGRSPILFVYYIPLLHMSDLYLLMESFGNPTFRTKGRGIVHSSSRYGIVHSSYVLLSDEVAQTCPLSILLSVFRIPGRP